MSTDVDYLELISSTKLSIKNIPRRKTSLNDNFITTIPQYAAQIIKAKRILTEHFNNDKKSRPLNSLILGPPGSGKSYLGNMLGETVDAEFLEYNLSGYSRPAEIKEMFEDIRRKLLELTLTSRGLDGVRIVVLVDEFDVKLSGVSAVQSLIAPIYDRRDLRNVAFVFSGSYVKNRKMLESVMERAFDFDFIRFLINLIVYERNPEIRSFLREHLELVKTLDSSRVNDPDHNVINYLRSLEKFVDFRSRINGFVIEIPNLDSPLDITTQRFRIKSRQYDPPTTPGANIFEEVVEFIKSQEIKMPRTRKSKKRESGAKKENLNRRGNDEAETVKELQPVLRFSMQTERIDQPLLEYKNAVLLERLSRVIRTLQKCHEPPVKVSREDLNYLVVVPLEHGMRSLEYLISNMHREIYPSRRGGKDRPIVFQNVDPEMLRMHIRDFDSQPSPEAVWSAILMHNPGFSDQKSSGRVKIKIEE